MRKIAGRTVDERPGATAPWLHANLAAEDGMKMPVATKQRLEGFSPRCAGGAVLSVVLLAGTVAEAQTPAVVETPVPVQTTMVVSPWGPPPPPLEGEGYQGGYYLRPPMTTVVPRAPASPQPPPDTDPLGRVAIETLAGLGMGAAFALAGGLLGYGLDQVGDTGSSGGSFSPGPGLILGMVGGWATGLPLGVMLAGRARGSRGGYGWALLGGCVGLTVSGVIDLAASSSSYNISDAGGWALIGSGMVLTLAGAVVGFELSSSGRHDDPPATASAFTVMPGFAALRGGGSAGLAGTF